MEYVTEYRYAAGVKPPAPATLPQRYAGDPHAYVRHLNHDRLPYLESESQSVRSRAPRHDLMAHAHTARVASLA